MCTRFIVVVSTLYLALSVASLKADWINLTGAETAPNIAEIYILDDHVKLVLEIFVRDLETFEELIPDDWLKDINAERPGLAERIHIFSSQKFQFVTETGEKLTAKINLVEPRLRKDRQSPFAGMINPITRQPVPEAPADKRVLYVELLFPFSEKPKTLTIIPPLDDEGRALVSIGFIAFHKSVPVIDFRYLGAAAELALNWEDPWYSKFDNPNLKRHHKDALMSFLYIEPYEVRHEILIRVRDVEEWIKFDFQDQEFIEIEELEPVKEKIGKFLLSKNKVKIDGIEFEPILDRINFVKVGVTGIQLMEKPERLETSSAIVGVIITYITKGMPQQVSVDWELFTDQVQSVPATSIDPAGPLLSQVTPEDNVHTWNNFLKTYTLPTVESVVVDPKDLYFKLPVGTLLCVLALFLIFSTIKTRHQAKRNIYPQIGVAIVIVIVAVVLYIFPVAIVSITRPSITVASLSEEEAHALAKTLLKNIYRAFDFRDEEHVYDKLALTVSGDLLTEVYLQNRKSLAIQKAGGAQAKIKEVDVLGVKVDPLENSKLGYVFTTKWTASGSVGHWGHVHIRKNLYEAILKVEAKDEVWKITGLELLDEKRIEPGAELVKKQ